MSNVYNSRAYQEYFNEFGFCNPKIFRPTKIVEYFIRNDKSQISEDKTDLKNSLSNNLIKMLSHDLRRFSRIKTD